jgi:hypothetical protein
MAKAKSQRAVRVVAHRVVDPARAQLRRRVVFHLTAGVLLLAAVTAGAVVAWRYVRRDIAFPPKPPVVVFKNRPAWMTDRLAQGIASSIRPKGAHSAFDHRMLVEIDQLLRRNPWVRKVTQVKRAYGRGPADTVEIDCEFRPPAALVRWNHYFHYVDAQGVLLPERFEVKDLKHLTLGQDGKALFRVIEGVGHAPPRQPGYKWAGEDLAAGLRTAAYIAGKPYTEEIRVVDVQNFGGRDAAREPQIVLVTKYNTRIQWGLPPGDKDEGIVEVRAERKLAYLQKIREQFGRVDMQQPWVNVRFDKITYPAADAPPTAHANGGRD